MPTVLSILVCLESGLAAYAQSTFQNLDFEQAQVSGYAPGSMLSTESALPGWTVDFTPGYGEVWYDSLSLGGALVSVCDSNTPWLGSDAVLEGAYSALLFGGAFGPSTIRQTGLVPSTARSLQMDIGNIGYTLFTISLGGRQLNMYPLATYPTHTHFGCDISSFAGREVTLSLTAPTPPSPVIPPSWFLVDSIVFSSEVVPEPVSFALCATGLLYAALRSRKCGRDRGHVAVEKARITGPAAGANAGWRRQLAGNSPVGERPRPGIAHLSRSA